MERSDDRVELAALVAAVSLAADLASGVTLEHGLRTCLLATRLAERAGLDAPARRDVYYTSLLRSIGCTSDAHEQSALFGNEIAARTELNLAAHLPPRQLPGVLARHAGEGAPPLRRAQALGRVLALGRELPRSVAAAHCQAAERLGRRLGFSGSVPKALNSLFERWGGKGYPHGLRGDHIPQAARFTQVAYDALLLHEHLGGDGRVAAAAGTLYDPRVTALLKPGDTAEAAGLLSPWDQTLAAEPGGPTPLTGDRLDEACRAAADFADLKSPWLLGHSRAVGGDPRAPGPDRRGRPCDQGLPGRAGGRCAGGRRGTWPPGRPRLAPAGRGPGGGQGQHRRGRAADQARFGRDARGPGQPGRRARRSAAGGVSQHWYGLTAFGPLARSAADAAAAVSALAGLDLSTAAEPPGRPLRIAVSARHPSPGARVARAVRTSLEQAANLLRAEGHTVTRARPPYPASLGLRFSSRWLAGIAEDARGLPAAVLEDTTRAMVRRGQRVARRVRPAAADPFAAQAAGWLGRYDALLTPTLARPAVPTGTWSGQGWVRAMLGVGNWLYTTPWNLAGLPAASVPFGFDQGLPLGLQIVAPAGGEQTVLALAARSSSSGPNAGGLLRGGHRARRSRSRPPGPATPSARDSPAVACCRTR